jgi:transposase-like protein
LAKLKRLASLNDCVVDVKVPVSEDELLSRSQNYPLLTPLNFAKKFRNVLFHPVEFEFMETHFKIQYNHCDDPFCKWFGLDQERFFSVKNKPSRYKLTGSSAHDSRKITCNRDPIQSQIGITWDCDTHPVSNWSIAEEIKRLATIESVKDWEPEYIFHKENCGTDNLNPFEHQRAFYKQGKSTGKSQRWQCKVCKKFTNVLPMREETTNYYQQRNDIIPMFIKLLLNRTPVKRTCEILQIGSETYYNKLEWMYRRCLEFMERHEEKTFKSKTFDTVWLNTDKMIYHLNNVRKKGQSSGRFEDFEKRHVPTHIIVTSDVFSRYVFRSDVAYDWNAKLENIHHDTISYKDDHLNDFGRKNARLRFAFAPQPPTENDPQTPLEYKDELKKFAKRGNYIDGLHVNSTYTATAHFWLLRQRVKAKEWRFITDEDYSIMTSIYRVFSKEIRLYDAHHFLSKIDRHKTKQEAYKEYHEARKDLKLWGVASGVDKESVSTLAYQKIKKQLETHSFYDYVSVNGCAYPKWAKNPIEHPLPKIDQGYRMVDCTTDLSSYERGEIAKMLMNVNDSSVNAFMNQIRRRLSILERPLVTARGDGKSYIYSNFNPKYAQFALTILRTYYNFCMQFKSYDGNKYTPAQRMGITKKQFTLSEIIYFK